MNPSGSLRIDTAPSRGGPLEAPASPRSPSFATTPTREAVRSVIQDVLPSFRISSEDGTTAATTNKALHAANSAHNRARNESRKLLAHILAQLQNRAKPPPLLSSTTISAGATKKSLGAVVKSVRGVVKSPTAFRGRQGHQAVPQDETDSEPEDVDDFTTDVTCDLMGQLKDVLILSARHKWDIFYDRYVLNPLMFRITYLSLL